MAELCLMASHGYPPGLVFNHDHGTKLFKDSQFSPNSNLKQEIAGSALFTLSPIQDQRFDRLNGMLEPRQWINPTVNTPVIIDRQDAIPNTQLISFDISNAKPDEILQLSMPVSSERAQEDFTRLSNFVDAMRKQVISQPFASLVYPSSKFDSQQLLLDFVGDLARNSKLMIHSDGRVEFMGSGTEMKDLLSVVAEFYLSRNSKFERHSSLVPHFNWLSTEEARSTVDASLKLQTATLPLKSPNKIKTPRKKNSRRLGQDRDLYKRNYFHACESLLSIMLDRRHQGKTAILSLKKAGPELPDLLNRFSTGIAGTGIAVLFSVMVQLASGRVPLCSSKVLSTGLGFGLVWLSWAVNNLGATVVHMRSRNGGKSGLKEEQMVIERVDKSLKEIYFRAVTVMMMAVLRLA